MSGFMQPEIIRGHFWVSEDSGDMLDSRYFGWEEAAKIMGCDKFDARLKSGYFARLSAPGYLDCTDWSGPFDTAEAAEAYIQSMYFEDISFDTAQHGD
jgi:hypothetical protein